MKIRELRLHDIVSVPVLGSTYRALVAGIRTDYDECYLKLLDYKDDGTYTQQCMHGMYERLSSVGRREPGIYYLTLLNSYLNDGSIRIISRAGKYSPLTTLING